MQRNLKQGEQWIVDNGHLVAWNCPYSIERTGGGLISGMHAGEGLVCRFTGPGTVFIQVNQRKIALNRMLKILFCSVFRHVILKLYRNGFQVMYHHQAVDSIIYYKILHSFILIFHVLCLI